MIVTAVLALIFLVAAGLMWSQGAWSNILTFFNLVFAGLVASSFFESLAALVEEQKMSGMRYVTDFFGWWLKFALTFVLMRVVTDLISRHRIEFQKVVEQVTCGLMCVVNGWILVCFVSMSFHLAPLNAEPFQEVDLGQPTFLGMSPDRMWLGFVAHQSKSTLGGENEFLSEDFIGGHRNRRTDFEAFDGYQAETE